MPKYEVLTQNFLKKGIFSKRGKGEPRGGRSFRESEKLIEQETLRNQESTRWTKEALAFPVETRVYRGVGENNEVNKMRKLWKVTQFT